MADIVIRGYKMPCNCGGCEFFLENSLGAKWCEIKFTPTEEAGRPEWCPLIALPEGHGRLVDADATAELLRSLGSRDYRREKGTICEAEKMVRYPEYTPTIVPAEKEGAV